MVSVNDVGDLCKSTRINGYDLYKLEKTGYTDYYIDSGPVDLLFAQK